MIASFIIFCVAIAATAGGIIGVNEYLIIKWKKDCNAKVHCYYDQAPEIALKDGTIKAPIDMCVCEKDNKIIIEYR